MTDLAGPTDARAALRERLGAGARFDSAAAPAHELDWARRGTAYFLRRLNELSDAELDGPSLLDGWGRREVVAHVGYNARALSRLVEWARTGTETPMYADTEQRGAEIALGATLPAIALRHLVEHSAVHLDVEWRDLPDEGWDASVRTIQGRTVPARETAWMRTREVWVHAIDLGNGGRFVDLPPDLLDEIARDVLRAWARRDETPDLTLVASDRTAPVQTGTADAPTVTGTTADLVRWLTGRGAGTGRLDSSTGTLPPIPRWF